MAVMRHLLGGQLVPLAASERLLLTEFFGGTLYLNRLQLRQGGILSWLCTRVVGNTIYFDHTRPIALLRQQPRGQSLLIHEAVHVWQFQHLGPGYIMGSLLDQGRYALATGHRHGAYRYRLEEGRRLVGYRPEQMAQLLEDYFRRMRFGDESSTHCFCLNYQELGRARADELAAQLHRQLWEG
ncbi:MAG: hypothetical protein HY335_00585 [Deinococcus sp.]|nr:hypothetical protein [Deinococcus sp.]